MPLSAIQKGVIGQLAFLADALVTGKGELEVYTPAADNEGRDAEVRRHLKSSLAVGIQIKIVFALVRNGRGGRKTHLVVRFQLAPNRVQKDPRLCYFFAFYDPHQLRFHDPVFLVPADVFHKMVHGRKGKGRRIWFEISTNLAPQSHDRFTPYRVALKDLGKRLLEIIDDAQLTAKADSLPLPPGAVVLWRAGQRASGARHRRAAGVDRKYRLIRNAVMARNSLSGWYQGHRRLFSPFLLGTKAGDPHVLGYQFDGTSEKPLAPDGSPENWRCLRIAELTKVKALPGIWHTVPMGKGFQHCIDQVDVSAYRPAAGKRQLRRAA